MLKIKNGRLRAEIDASAIVLKSMLGFAKQGLPVFPIFGITDGLCDCGNEECEHKGKHPVGHMARHGVKDATTDLKTIKKWHADYPTMNYGVATRGIAVVDTDSDSALNDFHQSIEPPLTLRVKTSRGFHFYFRGEVRTRTGVRPNLDIKSGEGSYVMGPGSIHESGKRYILMDDAPLAEVTPTIKALSEEGGQSPAITAGQPLPVGMRNTTLTRFAGFLNSRNVPSEAILEGLLAINQSFSSKPLPKKEVRGIVNGITTRYPAKPLPEMISFADVPDEQLEWLWFPFISFRTLCLLDGNPGEGKSQFTTWLCARISRGDLLPNGDRLEPANCFLCNFEDLPGAVIKKRLEANGADLDRVFVQSRAFRLDQEMVDWLEGEIVSKKVRLVILDPIQAVISKGTDANSNVDVREFMDRLREVSERNNCSIICVRHFGKAVHEKAMMKGIGSTDFVGIARNQLGLGKRKDGVRGFVLSAMKQSYGELGGALFTMAAADARKGEQPRVDFDQFVEIDADEFFGTAKGKRGPEPDQLNAAIEYLQKRLADGPVAVDALKRDCEARAISSGTRNRAADELDVLKTQHKDGWYWSLPPEE